MISKRRITGILLAVLGVMLLALVIWVLWANTALELNTYTLENEKLPETFDGYRIAHVSDLHNAEMGENNEKLLAILRDARPDMIAMTGDMIDSRNTNIQISLDFAEEAVKIAPCYYVTGNHESRLSVYEEFKQGLMDLGVTVLEDESVRVERGEESILLIGVNDPSFCEDAVGSDVLTDGKLKAIPRQEDAFTVLLSHRPELFDVYTENNMDLVLAGHAHGGQFRLPFVGGVIAPDQGLFPEYDAGLFTRKGTSMIVSRGIGNSLIPIRFNNRPEVLLIELKCQSQ